MGPEVETCTSAHINLTIVCESVQRASFRPHWITFSVTRAEVFIGNLWALFNGAACLGVMAARSCVLVIRTGLNVAERESGLHSEEVTSWGLKLQEGG